MKRDSPMRFVGLALLAAGVPLAGACGQRGAGDPAPAGAPPPAVVEHEADGGVLKVGRPDQFPVVTAGVHRAAPALTVTGVVAPDVSRAVPVVSLASGRVVELRARLGDRVRKGQVLLRVQSSDVSGAISDYRKAKADETLARTQLDRARDLFDRGAIARKDLEVAQDAADKAAVDVENSLERLGVLGIDPAHATVTAGVVNIVAPADGVITEQNVTPAAGIKTIDNSPNLFTISDLSHVWIVCDVYENDLRAVRLGDAADIHLAAYPERPLTGRIGNVALILDPSTRTAKVRIELANPGLLRVGMFVTATFHGAAQEEHAVVPAAAILHLHDRDWVYVATGPGTFSRQEVVSGSMLPGNMQEVVSGLRPGQRVAANALVLQNTTEQ